MRPIVLSNLYDHGEPLYGAAPATQQVNVESPGVPGLDVLVDGERVGVTPVMVTLTGTQSIIINGMQDPVPGGGTALPTTASVRLNAGDSLAQAQAALSGQVVSPGWRLELSEVGPRWALKAFPPPRTRPVQAPAAGVALASIITRPLLWTLGATALVGGGIYAWQRWGR